MAVMAVATCALHAAVATTEAHNAAASGLDLRAGHIATFLCSNKAQLTLGFTSPYAICAMYIQGVTFSQV